MRKSYLKFLASLIDADSEDVVHIITDLVVKHHRLVHTITLV